MEGSKNYLEALIKAVPSWTCHGFLGRDSNIAPQKNLQESSVTDRALRLCTSGSMRKTPGSHAASCSGACVIFGNQAHGTFQHAPMLSCLPGPF